MCFQHDLFYCSIEFNGLYLFCFCVNIVILIAFSFRPKNQNKKKIGQRQTTAKKSQFFEGWTTNASRISQHVHATPGRATCVLSDWSVLLLLKWHAWWDNNFPFHLDVVADRCIGQQRTKMHRYHSLHLSRRSDVRIVINFGPFTCRDKCQQ